MKYIILLIALGLTACNKDCVTCDAEVTGGDNLYTYHYSQEDDGECGLTMDTYRDSATARVEREVTILNSMPVFDSTIFGSFTFTNHNYSISCSK